MFLLSLRTLSTTTTNIRLLDRRWFLVRVSCRSADLQPSIVVPSTIVSPSLLHQKRLEEEIDMRFLDSSGMSTKPNQYKKPELVPEIEIEIMQMVVMVVLLPLCRIWTQVWRTLSGQLVFRPCASTRESLSKMFVGLRWKARWWEAIVDGDLEGDVLISLFNVLKMGLDFGVCGSDFTYLKRVWTLVSTEKRGASKKVWGGVLLGGYRHWVWMRETEKEIVVKRKGGIYFF